MIRKLDYEEAREYAIRSIRDFLEGTGRPMDWDDFISIPLGFADLEDLRKFCSELWETHPPAEKGWYCNAAGLGLLRERLNDLVIE
jgi:hypothetical protein